MAEFYPVKRPYELKTNSYPMQNFVIHKNIAIMTKGLYEYEIYNNELRICLLRAVGTISNPKNPARAIPAGPDLKTPKAQCLDEINEEFALCFGNKKEVFCELERFFENYVATDGNFREKINLKFAQTEQNSYICGINKNKIISYNLQNEKISIK